MRARFNYPTRILFGQGAIEDLAEEVKKLGVQRPLVVTDSGLMRTELPGRTTKKLTQHGLSAQIFSGVEANPNETHVEAGAQAYTDHRADGIVALGGGSPLDAAKAIQIRIHHHQPLEEYDDLKGGDAKILGPIPPLVAIPTTSGTGSEVSRSAVITVSAVGRKVVLFSPRLMPSVAICDPELTYGLPPRITGETGMDALSHNLEAFLSLGYHPMADGIALQGIRMIALHLPTAVAKGTDVLARQEMMMASTMGAVAFQKGLGVIHSLAHPLSTVSGLSHGLANAILMPHAIRFNGKAVKDRINQVAQVMGSSATSAEDVARMIEKLISSIGLPTTLQKAGVKEHEIPALVEKAMEDGCHTSNPIACRPEDMEQLLRAAF